MALAESGDWLASVPLFARAVALRESIRRGLALTHPGLRAVFNDRAHLLNALVHVGEWEAAGGVLATLTTEASGINSRRTLNLAARIAARIAASPEAPDGLADQARPLLAA
jgi:hypothetical protein